MCPTTRLSLPNFPEIEKSYRLLIGIYTSIIEHWETREVTDATIKNLSRERLMLIDKGLDEVRKLQDPEFFIALGQIFHDLLEIEIQEIEHWSDADTSLRTMIDSALQHKREILGE